MYDEFFNYARERQSIHLKKQAGLPRPWTDDQILDYFKFCSVFREDDRTTIWLRQNVREQIKGPELLLATIIFRWFNRISTGEAIFAERDIFGDGRTAWEVFLETKNVGILREAIVEHCGSGPYVTGAYCIIGIPHMSKLDGILACVKNVLDFPQPCRIIPGFTSLLWRDVADHLQANPGRVPLQDVWGWFRLFPRSGDFISYEVVTDLYHSHLMRGAPDALTWANAGPGAIRGLNRIHDRPLDRPPARKEKANQEMLDILMASQLPSYWPQYRMGVDHIVTDSEVFVHSQAPLVDQWPRWDMRTVEHTLCEFDKYNRIQEGGRVRERYRE
jgi:hypothetical protein